MASRPRLLTSSPSTRRLARGLRYACMLWIVFLGFVLPAWSHGVFDNSVALQVFEDHLEAAVTVGADSVRDLLEHSGLSAAEVEQAMMVGGPSSSHPLDPGFASQLISLSAGEQAVLPRGAKMFTDGLEAMIVIDYPRPTVSQMEFKALYFDAIPEMRQGAFIVMDDSRNQLASALLSSSNPSTGFDFSAPRRGRGTRAALTPAPALTNSPGTQTTIIASAAAPPVDEAIETPVDLPPPSPTQPSLGAFIVLGVEHILMGFDHLLFLGALLVGIRRFRPMLVVITGFTLAHSLTLALAALDVIALPSRVVEPVIAASIMVVCVENVVRRDAAWDRYWLASGFGLIHGFGFASVLRETGLGSGGASVVGPLFGFNLGVELGQLAVAGLVVPILFALRRWSPFSRYGTPVLSVIICVVGGYWLLERTVLAG